MHNPLSNQERQIVYGTMMGDGYLKMSKSTRHACFFTSASESHADYIFWKYEKIKAICPSEPHLYDNFLNGKVFPTYHLWSVRHSFFTRLRHMLYPEGKRVVKERLLNTLDSVGLAVWYMDDGQMVVNLDKKTGKPRGRYVVFNIQRYSLHDCDIIRQWFMSKFNIRCRLQYTVGQSPGSTGNRMKLCIGAVDAYHKLIPIIESHVKEIPSMIHKLDFQYIEGKQPPKVWTHHYKPSHSAMQVVDEFHTRQLGYAV